MPVAAAPAKTAPVLLLNPFAKAFLPIDVTALPAPLAAIKSINAIVPDLVIAVSYTHLTLPTIYSV